MLNVYEIKEKRCAMLIWKDEEIYIDLELSKATKERVKQINDLVGFPPKGRVMTHQYFSPIGE